jgi:hypothetical protein
MTLSRRLLFIAIIIGAFGCRSSDPTQTFVSTCTGGYHGNADPAAPLVCVSVDGSAATPLIDPVHVYTKGRNGSAAQIAWASADPKADLHVSMKDPSQGCVKSVACPRKQACFATIVENAAKGTQCEYQISNGGGTPMDPIIIVDGCCPGDSKQ